MTPNNTFDWTAGSHSLTARPVNVSVSRTDPDGALPYERDGHRMGAHAVAGRCSAAAWDTLKKAWATQ